MITPVDKSIPHEDNSPDSICDIRRIRGVQPELDARMDLTDTKKSARLMKVETPWIHGRVPDGYWDLRENRLYYLDWLGNRLGFQKPEDWYGVHRSDFLKNHGGGLFRICYDSSPYNAMKDYRPDFDWKPWLFGGAPCGFWHDVENRRTYMRWLGEKQGFTKPDDWYHASRTHFFENHGAGLLNNQYDGQVQKAVRELFPDHPWLEWLFANVSRGFWNSVENRRCFMNWMGAQLGYSKPEDWYRVRRDDFERLGGAGMLVGFFAGSIHRALVDAMPDFAWDANVLKKRRAVKKASIEAAQVNVLSPEQTISLVTDGDSTALAALATSIPVQPHPELTP